jgi:hypothetical protein
MLHARELDDACALFEISLSECSLLIAASGLQLLCDAWPAGTWTMMPVCPLSPQMSWSTPALTSSSIAAAPCMMWNIDAPKSLLPCHHRQQQQNVRVRQ